MYVYQKLRYINYKELKKNCAFSSQNRTDVILEQTFCLMRSAYKYLVYIFKDFFVKEVCK